MKTRILFAYPAALVWSMTTGAVFLAGCKRGVGSSCEANESRCSSRTVQLVCQQGHFIETPCRGLAGCVQADRGVHCDISGNREGDACSEADEGAATCRGRTLVVCRAGIYRELPCRGENGCRAAGERAVCDTSLADPGDRCAKPDTQACSSDHRQVLICRDGQMAALRACRGEGGCSVRDGKLLCDLSVAERGESCEAGVHAQNACSENRRHVMICRDGVFIDHETCPAGTRCVAQNGEIRCANSGAPL